MKQYLKRKRNEPIRDWIERVAPSFGGEALIDVIDCVDSISKEAYREGASRLFPQRRYEKWPKPMPPTGGGKMGN